MQSKKAQVLSFINQKEQREKPKVSRIKRG